MKRLSFILLLIGFSLSVHAQDETTEGIVYRIAEVNPAFPGGEGALANFLRENIEYPAFSREEDIEGEVFVQFVVNSDGRISNIELLKGIGGGCDEEAMRVV
ncbi:MAG: TonB family protein [Bacteroidia bacterium]|nr:TonB family protein [Bacteroidia bacterium]